ncbi:MAG: sodium-translocating pyrophosphatase [Planctomycetia bacterium]|nr:sodium-translocating pyrophosphatase [Planctomycetia bacterium]
MVRISDSGKPGRKPRSRLTNRLYVAWLAFLAVGLLAAVGWMSVQEPAEAAGDAAVSNGVMIGGVLLFEPLFGEKFSIYEKIALVANVVIALGGLAYAMMLVGQVMRAPQGTKKMQEIAQAIREGANAYLYRQFRVVFVLIVAITALLFYGAKASDLPEAFCYGRAIAFFVGAFFSATVGFVGMRLATVGNLRVAAAAKTSFGRALQLGYRTGTITGMLTDGLGLLGGTIIFLTFGEMAYEALLGFGFGGTLLALFMRVGGGIYTKAADVGADLVGKVEAGIPEDDPRNAATIADNVGDNVGDCAGMAADIFESYEVTIVAAMILGIASFGHKGVIFPLLVRAIGVVASIISTYSVRAGDKGSVAGAMKSVNRGFVIGSCLSIAGFILLGLGYLNFQTTVMQNGVEVAYTQAYPQAIAGFPRATADNITAGLPTWANFGIVGLDMRAAWTCLIGIILAVALNKCTEYYTGTEYKPVKGLAKACETGHATNIIQGLAVGYESTVAAVLIIAAAIMASALIYAGTNPTFVAFGVAMCGIGMLTLTGNTISMDVFGPVADNANGIGEMGYDRKEMGEAKYKEARQILADLDAVGNTTKAITKGIAIGSAVIAAVSLFNSYIVSVGSGGKGEMGQITDTVYKMVASMLTISDPTLFIGMLIGGAVPFLFSSMTIRAVGRAAFLIVKECRIQFRDKEIWAGTKKPDYGRVVNICTGEAQKELIGPALLAMLVPILVGYGLGVVALAGFLGGMIVVGQLLAVFMANAGGAWDNAKKMIEDEPKTETTGKGSEKHRAAVTGDTVGDPLKDTAGPAINPLIKVMNMVSLLIIGLILPYDTKVVDALKGKNVNITGKPLDQTYWIVIGIAVVGLVWAVWQSKREGKHGTD